MKKGFTLVELLVVVLIIGILSAVAIPMYQGAIDKSRWSTLLTPAKALQTAQAAAHLETGAYTEVADALVVSLPGEAEDNKYVMPDAQYTLQTKNDNQSTITGELTALPNVRLSMFMKHPDSYLFCDAKTGDSRAERLCEKLLGGTKAYSKDGYTQYLLDYPGTCAWSNTQGQCYTSEEARCTAFGMPYNQNSGLCGYTESYGQTLYEGGVCKSGVGAGCQQTVVNDGAICDASDANYAVQACGGSIINSGGICLTQVSNGTSSCQYVTINEGGKCIANAPAGCANISKNDGICVANAPGTCAGNYGKGCCTGVENGKYCPASAPKC